MSELFKKQRTDEYRMPYVVEGLKTTGANDCQRMNE